MRARVLALFAVLVFPVVVAVPAGAGGGGGGLCSGFTKGSEIAMRDYCFQGVAHIAQQGTITVTNAGQQVHNLVAVDGSFGIKGLSPGDRYEFTVDRPGAYPYYCTFHGSASGTGMAGVLVIEDRASLAAVRSDAADHAGGRASATATAATAATDAAKQPGSAWGWVALGALLLAGAALCVSLAVVRPRRT